jgi:hypothetical protein
MVLIFVNQKNSQSAQTVVISKNQPIRSPMEPKSGEKSRL